MKLTRRKLAVALVTAAAAPAQPPQPVSVPAPDSDLQAARERLLANSRALAAAPIPMATEPAFQFKA